MPLLPALLLTISMHPAALCATEEFPDNLSPNELDRVALASIAASSTNCMPAHYLLGYSYLGEKDRDLSTAIGHLERARELKPRHADTLTLLGQAYLMRAADASSLSDATSGRDLLERAVAVNPENIDAMSALAAFYRQAPWIAGGDMEEAYALSARIRMLDLKRGLVEQARTLFADGEEEDAARLLGNAVDQFPSDGELATEYAVLMQRGDAFEEAHRVLVRATRGEHADLSALYQLGRTAAVSGKFLDDGKQALKRYIERGVSGESLPIEAAAAWWRLGLIEELADNVDAARAAFTQSLALNPDFEEAATALQALDD